MEDQDAAVFANPRPIITTFLAKTNPAHEEEHHPDSASPVLEENATFSSDVAPQLQPQDLETPVEHVISLISSTTTQTECSACENTFPESLWFCGVCKLAYCDSCWEMQATHKVKSKALVPTPHEKTPLDIAEKVGKVLAPAEDVQKREELHREDENTAWFGT
jgi:hypothetical protein